jgi:hypothetical protein
MMAIDAIVGMKDGIRMARKVGDGGTAVAGAGKLPALLVAALPARKYTHKI